MIRQIKINFVLNGFIVTAGCQVVVFQTREHLIQELKRYLEDPIHVEKEFLSKSINRDLVKPLQDDCNRVSAQEPAACPPPESILRQR